MNRGDDGPTLRAVFTSLFVIARSNAIKAADQFDLGLRWLDADPDVHPEPASDWFAFLLQADSLPSQPRLRLARLWPWLAAFNGVLAMTGLNVWPGGGVHLLGLLAIFWAVPLLLWVWQCSALVTQRAPWWRPLLTRHHDAVINRWCARQALQAQWVFVAAGLVTLWVMLLGREVVFYWSTSIPAVSGWMDSGLALLSLGLIDAPDPLIISASQAGAVSGWQQNLLSYSYYWAAWLSQVLALWVLLPLSVLLLVQQWRWRSALRRWTDHNHHLRLRFQAAQSSVLTYRALDVAQSDATLDVHPLDERQGIPQMAGFVWHLERSVALAPGCQPLGDSGQRQDEAMVQAHAAELSAWYCPARLVPTGDLADLLLAHRAAGGAPQLYLLAAMSDGLDTQTLALNWRHFARQQGLGDLPITLCWLENGHD
ncbi:DUF2868 domain-containing protein [Saccharospirillum mangrovi]|uniref:DUF2868 domain-containing protein n=1 Tax=Saccharospirillum mangrovi TaxID=2161747 RepID=UPI000D36BE41|nr:DUF2868 domain-containing protein [Saccharospirillum mangrovi]